MMPLLRGEPFNPDFAVAGGFMAQESHAEVNRARFSFTLQNSQHDSNWRPRAPETGRGRKF